MIKKVRRKSSTPEYPYLPEGRTILHVPLENIWMQAAMIVCERQSGCAWWPTGAVVVRDDRIIGRGANHSGGTITIPCPRYEMGSKTGENYHLCTDVCGSFDESHAEYNAIKDAQKNDQSTENADVFLFGHWWCCERCWQSMLEAKIRNVYLLESAHKIFTKEKRSQLMDSFKGRGETAALSRKDIMWIV